MKIIINRGALHNLVKVVANPVNQLLTALGGDKFFTEDHNENGPPFNNSQFLHVTVSEGDYVITVELSAELVYKTAIIGAELMNQAATIVHAFSRLGLDGMATTAKRRLKELQAFALTTRDKPRAFVPQNPKDQAVHAAAKSYGVVILKDGTASGDHIQVGRVNQGVLLLRNGAWNLIVRDPSLPDEPVGSNQILVPVQIYRDNEKIVQLTCQASDFPQDDLDLVVDSGASKDFSARLEDTFWAFNTGRPTIPKIARLNESMRDTMNGVYAAVVKRGGLLEAGLTGFSTLSKFTIAYDTDGDAFLLVKDLRTDKSMLHAITMVRGSAGIVIEHDVNWETEITTTPDMDALLPEELYGYAWVTYDMNATPQDTFKSPVVSAGATSPVSKFGVETETVKNAMINFHEAVARRGGLATVGTAGGGTYMSEFVVGFDEKGEAHLLVQDTQSYKIGTLPIALIYTVPTVTIPTATAWTITTVLPDEGTDLPQGLYGLCWVAYDFRGQQPKPVAEPPAVPVPDFGVTTVGTKAAIDAVVGAVKTHGGLSVIHSNGLVRQERNFVIAVDSDNDPWVLVPTKEGQHDELVRVEMKDFRAMIKFPGERFSKLPTALPFKNIPEHLKGYVWGVVNLSSWEVNDAPQTMQAIERFKKQLAEQKVIELRHVHDREFPEQAKRISNGVVYFTLSGDAYLVLQSVSDVEMQTMAAVVISPSGKLIAHCESTITWKPLERAEFVNHSALQSVGMADVHGFDYTNTATPDAHVIAMDEFHDAVENIDGIWNRLLAQGTWVQSRLRAFCAVVNNQGKVCIILRHLNDALANYKYAEVNYVNGQPSFDALEGYSHLMEHELNLKRVTEGDVTLRDVSKIWSVQKNLRKVDTTRSEEFVQFRAMVEAQLQDQNGISHVVGLGGKRETIPKGLVLISPDLKASLILTHSQTSGYRLLPLEVEITHSPNSTLQTRESFGGFVITGYELRDHLQEYYHRTNGDVVAFDHTERYEKEGEVNDHVTLETMIEEQQGIFIVDNVTSDKIPAIHTRQLEGTVLFCGNGDHYNDLAMLHMDRKTTGRVRINIRRLPGKRSYAYLLSSDCGFGMSVALKKEVKFPGRTWSFEYEGK